MKKYCLIIVALFFSFGVLAQNKAGKVDSTKHELFYSCPKHSDITKHEAGKCPKCGMELNLSPKEINKANTVKNYTCPVHLDVTSNHAGKCSKCGRKLNLSAKEQMKSEVVKSFSCESHPEVSMDKQGKCPKCNKTLVEKNKQ